mmetsp:Transcript_67313/g.140624  ORF Transcript_67313/g.140624 Transcript_67313/m.140624 type:complete len:228 (-) Transcript_67313:622-1305(-)
MAAELMHISIFLLLLAIVGMVVVGMLSTKLGGTGNILFGWHPILMTISFVLFMGLAVHSYRVELMPKLQRRKAHALLNLCVLLCAAGGYYAIWKSHHDKGASQFAYDEPKLERRVHVWLGYVCLGLLILQSLIGLSKFVRVHLLQGEPMLKWHGFVGRVIFLAGMAEVFVGVLCWSSWSFGYRMALFALVVVAAASVLIPSWFMAPPRHSADQLSFLPRNSNDPASY